VTTEEVGANVSARQERLASRILDDERLRGDLTDDAFQPLLNWALSITDRIAASTADLDDAAAEPVLDTKMGALRAALELAVAAVAAHESGEASATKPALADLARDLANPDLRGLLGARTSDGSKRARSPLASSKLLAGDPTAPELARRIAAALTPADATPNQGTDSA
jgi:hypothetical protein